MRVMPAMSACANVLPGGGTAAVAHAVPLLEGEVVGVFYAQIRFRGSREWVTVAKAESRRSAFEYAMAAFQASRDDAGRSPAEARVLTPVGQSQAAAPADRAR
jgi:hypothetical protein